MGGILETNSLEMCLKVTQLDHFDHPRIVMINACTTMAGLKTASSNHTWKHHEIDPGYTPTNSFFVPENG